MNLKELLDTYPECHRFRELFPNMYRYARRVKVVPWKEEYAICDRRDEDGRYISRTAGISFTLNGEVSFREEKPPFHIIVHELGHVYFKLTDETLWNASYAGAESVLWLIYDGKLEGNEDTVRKYIQIRRLLKENPELLCQMLNSVAQSLGAKNAAEYCSMAGMLLEDVEPESFPDELSEENLQAVLHTMLEGAWYRDLFWSVFLKSLLNTRL